MIFLVINTDILTFPSLKTHFFTSCKNYFTIMLKLFNFSGKVIALEHVSKI